MTTEELAVLLTRMGCPGEKSSEIAAQLEKRAGQLAIQKNKTRDEALFHLLNLMKAGWAAQSNPGPSSPPPAA